MRYIHLCARDHTLCGASQVRTNSRTFHTVSVPLQPELGAWGILHTRTSRSWQHTDLVCNLRMHLFPTQRKRVLAHTHCMLLRPCPTNSALVRTQGTLCDPSTVHGAPSGSVDMLADLAAAEIGRRRRTGMLCGQLLAQTAPVRKRNTHCHGHVRVRIAPLHNAGTTCGLSQLAKCEVEHAALARTCRTVFALYVLDTCPWGRKDTYTNPMRAGLSSSALKCRAAALPLAGRCQLGTVRGLHARRTVPLHMAVAVLQPCALAYPLRLPRNIRFARPDLSHFQEGSRRWLDGLRHHRMLPV